MRFELIYFGVDNMKANEQTNKEAIKQEMQKSIIEQEETRRVKNK